MSKSLYLPFVRCFHHTTTRTSQQTGSSRRKHSKRQPLEPVRIGHLSECPFQCSRILVDIDITNPPPAKTLGWPSGCSPESPLRLTTFNLNNPPPPPTKKTFIYDHAKAMDPCIHPSLLHHHGQFLTHSHGPVPDQIMIPQFSYSSTTLHNDIVPATPNNWIADVHHQDDPDYEDKLDERLLWRGTTTGMFAASNTRWRSQQRMRLVAWANERNGTAFVLPPTKKTERVGKGKLLPKSRLNPAMMDIAYADE